MVAIALKLTLSCCLFIGSLLLLGENGWFSIGLVVALPLIILYWIDLGRELRESTNSGRFCRMMGLLMGVPQALFGVACAVIGLSIIGWVLYNLFWKLDPDYIGVVPELTTSSLLTLYGIGYIFDAFKRQASQDDNQL